jgi:hypothetical protein
MMAMFRERMSVILAAIVGVCFLQTSAGGEPGKGASEPSKFITVEELDRLPVGLRVVHEPNPALATLTGESKRRSKYTWWYKTSVSATGMTVRIVEFGAFVWHKGKWVQGGSFTGRPYNARDFAEWYSCPNAVLKPKGVYVDPTDWSSAPELQPGRMRCYFIGVDEKGRRVKGEAVIELKGEVDPKKPKDAGKS